MLKISHLYSLNPQRHLDTGSAVSDLFSFSVLNFLDNMLNEGGPVQLTCLFNYACWPILSDAVINKLYSIFYQFMYLILASSFIYLVFEGDFLRGFLSNHNI